MGGNNEEKPRCKTKRKKHNIKYLGSYQNPGPQWVIKVDRVPFMKMSIDSLPTVNQGLV